jgi:hypothetical protein
MKGISSLGFTDYHYISHISRLGYLLISVLSCSPSVTESSQARIDKELFQRLDLTSK